jgi:putative intracellular protease/amidase
MGGRPTGVWLSELADPYYAFQAAGLEVTVASIAGGPIPIDPGSMGENFFGEKAKKFMLDQTAVAALTHSVKVEASMADQFDCVYLAGGHGCCVDFVGGAAKELKALIADVYAQGKVLAADCHGPMGLLEATIMVDRQEGAKGISSESLVKGLEVTAFTNVEEDQAGATEWVKANSVFMEDEFQKLGAVFKKGDPWTAHVCKLVTHHFSERYGYVTGHLITAQNPQSADACAAAVIEALA